MEQPQVRPASVPLLPLAVCACAILVVVGSFGPWASVLFITVNGTDDDGLITVMLGLAAGFLAVLHLVRPGLGFIPMLGAATALVAAAAFGAYGWANLDDIAAQDEDFGLLVRGGQAFGLQVDVGWGLVVTTLGAALGAVLAVVGLAQSFRTHPSANTPPDDPPRTL